MIVGNRDKCGRCGTRHGGNNRSCPVHGAVSAGCCEPACDKKDYIVLYDVYTNGNIKSVETVLVTNADLTDYTPDGRAFSLPKFTRRWKKTGSFTDGDILAN